MANIYRLPNIQLVDELNTLNAETLPSNISYGNLTFNSIVSTDTETGLTEAQAVAKGSSFTETLAHPNLTYYRYLADRLLPDPMVITGEAGDTYGDIANRIAVVYRLPPWSFKKSSDKGNDLYGAEAYTQLLESDFVNDVARITLNFTPDSEGYIGKVNIAVLKDFNNVNVAIKKKYVDGLHYYGTTNGLSGSLEILNYPVKFEIPDSYRTTLTTEGTVLGDDWTDPLFGILSANINKCYLQEGNDGYTMERTIGLTLVKAVVKTVKYSQDGTLSSIIIEPTSDYTVWTDNFVMSNITWVEDSYG